MKKIFTSIALVAACAVGAEAQKNVDLGVKFLNPPSQTITQRPNMTAGQTMTFSFELSNNGTANIEASDSLICIMFCGIRTSPGNEDVRMNIGMPANFTLAAGQKDTLSISFNQGEVIGTTSSGAQAVANYPSNANDTFQIAFFGMDAAGDWFDDPGTDGNGAIDPSGSDNVDVAVVQFGGVGIKDILAGAKKEALSVYPNPTKGDLKFDYDFKNATDAAIRVTDIAGRVVYTQALGKQAAGKQAFNINLGNLANGMYTIELNAGDNRATSQFNINK